MAALRKAMPDDWRAAEAYLKRAHSERWSEQFRTEVTGRDGGPVVLEHKAGLTLRGVCELAKKLEIEVDVPDPGAG